MYISNIRKQLSFVLLSAVLFLFPVSLSAQTRISSPYSIFGVGELRLNQNFRNMGMGGLGIGYRSNTSINDVNPASYTAIDSLSFLFEATVFSHLYHQKTSSASQIGNYTTLGSFAFSFPATRWWSIGFGLRPFSSVGYKIHDSGQDDILGTMHFLYEGSGGINQVYVGQAFSPVKGLSIGVNVSYLFGNLQRFTSVYSDSLGIYRTNKTVSNDVKGWHAGFGLQYHAKMGSEGSITLGGIYGLQTDLDITRGEVVQRMLPGFTRYDTIRYVQGEEGRMQIPTYWGAGAFARLNAEWAAGMDFQQQKWEDFRIFDRPDRLANSYQFAFGMQHNPKVQTFSSAFSRLEYRAGIRYGKTYLQVQEQQLNEFGINFGVGIPLRRSLSGLNLSFEYARRGNTSGGLIQENFYRFNIGVNVHERWFLRSKFF